MVSFICNTYLLLFAGLITLPLVGCSSNFASIRTNPEGAGVYLVNRNNQKTRLGATPLSISSSQLNPLNESNVQLKIEKEGYKEESFFIPKMVFSSNIDLSVQMIENPPAPSCEQQAANTGKVARNIAQAIFFTQQKKYPQAEVLLNNLIAENPQISVLYDLLGNIYYMNQQTDLAIDAYGKSLELNPNSAETQRMYNKLKLIRVPAGGN